MFYKKGVLKNFAIFTRKHLCRSLFFINLKTFRPSDQQLYQKGPPTQVFSSEHYEFFKNILFVEHLRTAASCILLAVCPSSLVDSIPYKCLCHAYDH